MWCTTFPHAELLDSNTHDSTNQRDIYIFETEVFKLTSTTQTYSFIISLGTNLAIQRYSHADALDAK
jgi:hypothetical protein